MNWWLQPATILWCESLCASFVLSAVATWLSLHYARRKNLIDLPGQRRSHSSPTPRGGGLGIVVAVIAGLALFAWYGPTMAASLRLLAAVALIGAVGWIDDHRPLPAWSRLRVHCVAVAVWLTPLIQAALFAPAPQLAATSVQAAAVVVLFGFACVWSINLHNFMDGIDGLLALQAIFVLTTLTVLCLRDDSTLHSFQLGLWASAIAGFALFNFPRARIFMGDVGSGVVGMLIAVAIIWQLSTPQVAAASGIIAASAFVVDASCTLVSRMLRGRRWYSAHREHLYQWMTRAGMSHARVVAWYMGWNLLVVVPVLWWINRLQPRVTWIKPGYTWAAAVYALALVLWVFGKRWCSLKVKSDP
jgi:UDP-N-acetylmuramyl pentapeptide phosphotransferase/UDP-N-acetylglucosamine-1-phosphate transferase